MLPEANAPAHARQWLREMLTGFSSPRELLDDTLIVVDELVSNSVRHAATPIVVTLEYASGVCRCAVTDRCTSGPLPRLLERADGSGRGLRIVNAIASSWGVERSNAGTTVWVQVGAGG
jgi:anti-sigma regulatory factor (Ser/Thr protein kinase)